MILKASPHQLQFLKPAKTSRGSYQEKEVLVLSLESEELLLEAEAAPLSDLSIDGKENLALLIKPFVGLNFSLTSLYELLDFCEPYPSLRFAVYTLIQKASKENGVWVDSAFTRSERGIKINGLVWMNDIESMEQEAESKIAAGFTCIKFKVGALDFDAECRMLERFRKKHPESTIEIRLDANGAFPKDVAGTLLKDLSRFGVHSIEQPIAPGNWDEMARLCKESAIDVALDEELIGIAPGHYSQLLKEIKPQYLILKPTLIGGFDRCDHWIQEAQKHKIQWWSTSALEGNIGLFDIAQWVSGYDLNLPQGLGTGSLFVKNFPQNTLVQNGILHRL